MKKIGFQRVKKRAIECILPRHFFKGSKKFSFSEELFEVCRPGVMTSIGSNIMVYLGMLRYMESTFPDCVPYINAANITKEYSCEKFNSWESLFYSLPTRRMDAASIKQYKSIVYSNWSKIPEMTIPQDDPHMTWSSLSEMGWTELFRKYIIIKAEVIDDFEREWHDLFCQLDGNILGIMARGTDYWTLKPEKHCIQPTIEELVIAIDSALQKESYVGVFLATEDKTIAEALRKRYGNKLITIHKEYVEYTGGYLSTYYSNKSGTTWDNVQRNYLKEMFFLSKCTSLISGCVSGLITVLLLNEGQFKDVEIFDLGRY